MKFKSLLLLSLIPLSACAGLGPRERASSAGACADLTVQVYFERGAAAVSPAGQQVLNSAAAIARKCHVSSVDMAVPPDAAGDPEVDPQLSTRRVEAIVAILASAGLRTTDFPVSAPRPIRRRADVTFHLAPP